MAKIDIPVQVNIPVEEVIEYLKSGARSAVGGIFAYLVSTLVWMVFVARENERSKPMSEFEHWCGNCQIRVYIERHYGKRLSWEDCPYTCEYGTAMRCSIKEQNDERNENIHGKH